MCGYKGVGFGGSVNSVAVGDFSLQMNSRLRPGCGDGKG